MKKLVFSLILLTTLFTLISCGDKKSGDNDNDNTPGSGDVSDGTIDFDIRVFEIVL